jgi:hypothetical protein
MSTCESASESGEGRLRRALRVRPLLMPSAGDEVPGDHAGW